MIRISPKLQNLLIKALNEASDAHTMEKLLRRLVPDYDLYERTGYPPNIPITSMTAANQIVKDVIGENLFNKFVAVLMDVYRNGLMGRQINIRLLPQILKELENEGYVYNAEYGTIMENRKDTMSIGWGLLEEGKTYELSFLRIDIVQNSKLVRRYSKEIIDKTYTDLREFTRSIVERRNGRIWMWEGDGGIAAFFIRHKNIDAVLSGIDLLVKLHLYNLFERVLEEPLSVRMAIHAGPSQFFRELDKVQNDTIRRLEIIESQHTAADTLTLSAGVHTDLGGKLDRFFEPVPTGQGPALYRFKLRWEE